MSTERRRRDPIYLQLPYVPLEEAEALFDGTPLDVVLRRVVALERVGHDARGGRASRGEERLEAQLELGLLLEVECVDLRARAHAREDAEVSARRTIAYARRQGGRTFSSSLSSLKKNAAL